MRPWILTLLAAMGGGKAGERYHRKIDRFGYTPTEAASTRSTNSRWSRDVLAAVGPDLPEPGPERRQVDPL